MKRRRRVGALAAGILGAALVVAAIATLGVRLRDARGVGEVGAGADASFVGGARCVPCHEAEYRRWRGSHHDRAMDVASDSSVLGDFDDAEVDWDGVRTRFFRRDGRYWVRTGGPDGVVGDFEIAYTFGFDPLQQYLIPMPGGRVQVLGIAWDVDRGAWFDVYPDRVIPPGDWLHWTGNGQTWNGMCAECHSTNLRKGFDPASGTFATTWTDIDVGCEACHGPGSRHVEWADGGSTSRNRDASKGLIGITSRTDRREQVERCAPCHSRRVELGDYDHTEPRLLDRHAPELLSEGVYFPDGQILEEVYVYGSFVQSAMYRQGVGCSDCHDPHRLDPVADGAALCLRCHAADSYDSDLHHHHGASAPGGTGGGGAADRTGAGRGPSSGSAAGIPGCVDCHMPERTYMVVDARGDHSFPVPRPDLSVELGVPNACARSGCHDDRSDAWAALQVERWHGPARRPHFGAVLAAGREGRPEAGPQLARIAADTSFPFIARATAVALLGAYPGEQAAAAVTAALADDEALVRHAALGALPPDGADGWTARVAPLLFDPVRSVRLLAAGKLAGAPAATLEPPIRERWRELAAEYRQALERSLDLASVGHNLGNLATRLGQAAEAERYYRAAIEADDRFFPASMNLAVLYSATGRERDAEALLRGVLEAEPGLHEAAYSLGLLLAERRTEEAVALLRRAATGMPDNARLHYNLGLALQMAGRAAEAERPLRRALELAPGDRDFLHALADHYLRREKLGEALEIAERMIAAHPSDPVGREVKAYVEAALREARPH